MNFLNNQMSFGKMFDEVDWDFILEILKVGFVRQTWREWITGCISTTNFFIIINGRPRGKILSSKGFQQGDPLSPTLHIDC